MKNPKKAIPEQPLMKPPRPIDVLYSLIKKIPHLLSVFDTCLKKISFHQFIKPSDLNPINSPKKEKSRPKIMRTHQNEFHLVKIKEV